jgi:hypothetical protein
MGARLKLEPPTFENDKTIKRATAPADGHD